MPQPVADTDPDRQWAALMAAADDALRRLGASQQVTDPNRRAAEQQRAAERAERGTRRRAGTHRR